MNREIIFRGKRIDNREWVEGYFFKIWHEYYILWGTTNGTPNMLEVIPETVGMFTGLTDKNGKKIFEGDMVKARHNQNLYTVYFEDCRFFIEDCYGNVIRMHQDAINHLDCEIIGNIHEEVTK